MRELFSILTCKVGLDKANKSPDTRLLYVTTGVLKVCICTVLLTSINVL